MSSIRAVIDLTLPTQSFDATEAILKARNGCAVRLDNVVVVHQGFVGQVEEDGNCSVLNRGKVEFNRKHYPCLLGGISSEAISVWPELQSALSKADEIKEHIADVIPILVVSVTGVHHVSQHRYSKMHWFKVEDEGHGKFRLKQISGGDTKLNL